MQAPREGAKHDEERRALSLSPLSGTESELVSLQKAAAVSLLTGRTLAT